MVSLAMATVLAFRWMLFKDESGLYLLFGDLCLSPPSCSVPEFFPEITRETGPEPRTKSHHTLSAGREDRLKKCRDPAEPLRGTGLADL